MLENVRGVSLTVGADFAELRAFDHVKAWSCSFAVTYGILLISPGIPSRWWLQAAFVAIAAWVFACGYRVVVRLERRNVRVVHSWLMIAYRTRDFDAGSVGFELAGTGDWGLPGDWPIAEVCAVVDRSHRRTYIGPARARQAIHQALSRQWQRLSIDASASRLGDEGSRYKSAAAP